MDKIIIGAESAGFELKEIVKYYLVSLGYEVEDVGTYSKEEFAPYYEIASKVAEGIQSNEYQKGMLFCGTGMGMSIVANKFRGVYASVVESSYAAKMCTAINNSNILTMGGWIIEPIEAIDIVENWLNTSFTEGFEDIKDYLSEGLKEVKKIEDNNFNK